MRGAAPLSRSPVRFILLAVALLAAPLAAAGCGRSGSAATPSTGGGAVRLQVVAAENFWGSIAPQLAGGRASVRSIIVNPSADPHTSQPSARAARSTVAANVALVNGLG